MLYSLERFLVEGLRTDSLMIGGFKQAQVISAVIFAFSFAAYIYLSKKKEAGVKSILMSLKKVDDEATRILMVDFYNNLMKGKTKLQSLKDAQKHLRQIENGKYNDPIYWASFIMLDGLN